MSIDIRTEGKRAVVTVSGPLTGVGRIEGLDERIADLLQRGFDEFVLALNEMSHIDSRLLGQVVRIHITITRRGGSFRVIGLTGRVSEFLSVAQVGEQHETVGEAGVSIDERVFERAEMTRAIAELEQAPLVRSKAGARHVLHVPSVRRLATDRRVLDIAARAVGPTPVPFRATLFDKSQASNWLVVWHQDTALPLCARVPDPGWGPWSEKSGTLHAHAPAWALERIVALRVHLDASTADNGPLRVLPRTHLNGVLSDEEMRLLARDVAPVECLAPSGGVVAMRPLIVHASSKASASDRRRVLHIEYAASVHLGAGIELAAES